MTPIALPLAATAGLFVGAGAQAPPARVLGPLPHTTYGCAVRGGVSFPDPAPVLEARNLHEEK